MVKDEPIIKTHPDRHCCSVCPVWGECNKNMKGTEEVEVNEYGEIVSKRHKNKGVKIKPHTFYGVDI